MDRRTNFIRVIAALLLISVIKKVKTDISDDECGIFSEEEEFSNETTSSLQAITPKKDYRGRPRPDQKSLLIVFDATGSMSDDLAQLRSGAKEIVNKLANIKESPIYNYVLSVFRDPEVNPLLVTKNSSELLVSLDAITVNGGGDCPEVALKGLKFALEHALPNSLAYVFSDASAKDYELYDHVADLLQKKNKKVQVSFLMTGSCSDGKSAPGYVVYEKLARVSGGQLFDMQRSSIENVLLAITEQMDSHYESLKAFDSDVAGKSRVTLKVDQSFKTISVSLSGKNSKLAIKNEKDENIKSESLVSLDNVKVLRIEATNPSYHIEASADSGYSIRVGGISDLKLDFGFSTNVPSQKAETSAQALIGFPNIISIFISDPNLIKCLTRVTIIPFGNPDDSTEIKIPLVRYKRYLYASAPYNFPTKMFKIVINGYDKKGNELERSFATGIKSVEGYPPEVEIEESNLRINQYQQLYLDCKVSSLTPTVTTWMFENHLINTTYSNQSTSVVLEVGNFDVKNVGKYVCKATNSLGEAIKEVSITIRMAPIVEIEPKAMEISEGEIGSLTCKVSNTEGNYKIHWIELGEEEAKNENIYNFTASKYHHNKNISCIVQNGEFVVSSNCSIVVLYAPDFIKGTNGGNVRRRIRHGKDFSLNCDSKEYKEAEAKWSFKPENSNKAVDLNIKTKILKLQNMNSSKEGEYTCLLKNLVGNATKNFNVIHVSNSPPVIESSEDIVAKVGEDVQLECLCRHCLPVKSSWIYKNKLARKRIKEEKFIDEEKDIFQTRLTISQIVEGDVGDFKCALSSKNEQGKIRTVQKDIKLITHIEPRDITITGRKGKQDVLVKPTLVLREPIDFTFKCIANAYPIPTITWYRNDKKIGDKEVTLLKNDTRNNAGNYTCVVKNVVGTLSQSVQVKLEIAPFTFSDKKRVIAVENGAKVELKCDINGNPDPVVIWLFKGEPLVTSKDIKLSKDRRKVELVNRVESIGEYSCTGNNTFGKESISFSVFIKGPPSIINALSEIKVQSEDDFHLTCETLGYPIPEIEWIVDEKVIQKGGSLEIKESGLYECRAENIEGIVRKTFNVSVVEFPSFISTLDDVKINPNDFKKQFKVVGCSAFGVPDPDVYWIYNDKQIQFGDVLNITSMMNSGEYKCVAENSEGRIETTFTVEILKEPELLDDFDESQSNQVVPEGVNLEFICPFKNYEEFIWTREEKPLDDYYNKTLEIIAVDLQFKGNYKCIAFNEAGNSSFTYTLDVLTKPSIEVLDHGTNKTLLKSTDEEKKLLQVNEELKMSCTSHGNPKPKVVWKKSLELIGEGDSYDIISASVNDIGNYTCSAENSQGIASKTFIVNVFNPPFIKDGFKDIRVLEFVNDTMTLDCIIDGYPKPKVTWFKDEVEIENVNNSLVIKKLSRGSLGLYKCYGDNGYGIESIEFFVSLKEPAKIMKAEEVKINDKHLVMITCVVKGRPLSDITWTDGKSMLVSSVHTNKEERFERSPHSTIYLNDHGSELLHYDINDLTRSNDNFFSRLTNIDKETLKLDMIFKRKYFDTLAPLKCFAKNDKGSDEKNIVRRFIRFDDIIGSKKIYTVKWGQQLDLECSVVGSPEPSITWKFNNKFVVRYKNEFTRIDGGKKLRILKVEKKHGGNSIFKCNGTNSADSLTRTFQVKVDMKPRWTTFSEWGKCNVTCGDGVQKRSRTCILLDNSMASSNRECGGEDFEIRVCKENPCDGWGEWSSFSACSRTCGKGYMRKTRKCVTLLSPEGRNWCEGPKEFFQYCDNPTDSRCNNQLI